MNVIIIILTGVLGATLTFYVSKELKQGPVRASALLSLIVGLFFYCFPEICNAHLSENIQIVFIGASFIGMVSPKVNSSYFRLALAGIVFSIIYTSKSQFFEGYGGALGALALIALLTAITFSDLISRNTTISNRILEIKKLINRNKK